MSTLTLQTLHDGERNAVIKGYITGNAVELSNELFVDVSGLSGAPSEVRIDKIQANLNGFSGTLLWDATANVAIVDIAPNDDVDQCYKRYGGLTNNAGAGVTGDVLLSTTGIAVGENGFIILSLVKKS